MTSDLFSVSKAIVVITGASGQLGSSYAQAFLERGARVFGIDVALSKFSEEHVNKYREKYYFCTADVTSKLSLSQALDVLISKFGPPTVLINNAAVDSPPSAPPEENGSFEDYPESSWDRVIDVNLRGVFLCCQIFGARMALEKNGSIINVASIYGQVSPDQNIYVYRRQRGEIFYKPIAYSASKSGIYNLTRYLATYWAKMNVRVNTLTIAGVFNNQEDRFIEAYCKRIPVGRMAKIHEYDGAVLFLSSQASEYMTGANIVIDGGWTAI